MSPLQRFYFILAATFVVTAGGYYEAHIGVLPALDSKVIALSVVSGISMMGSYILGVFSKNPFNGEDKKP